MSSLCTIRVWHLKLKAFFAVYDGIHEVYWELQFVSVTVKHVDRVPGPQFVVCIPFFSPCVWCGTTVGEKKCWYHKQNNVHLS